MSLPSDRSVTVRLKRGAWEVEISCPLSEVERTVQSVIAGLGASIPEAAGGSTSVMSGASMPAAPKKTCRSLLRELWEEAWFQTERALGDVDQEMGRRGYHFDRTAVAHALMDLVREGLLTRAGEARSYRYVQKRPAVA